MTQQTQTATDAISATIQLYLDGAKTGDSTTMARAFRDDATIFGHLGPDLIAGPIQILYDWHTDNGPASELNATIAQIDLAGTVATARVEITNWTGHRFTDLFTLIRTDDQWKIANKVFHLHEA